MPAGVTLEELAELVETVAATGLTYMMGETSYYHDMSHGFYKAYQHSGRADWRATASFPPMLHPQPLGQHDPLGDRRALTDVSCLGWVDDHDDGVFRAAVSRWGNELSNETALFRTSDGGAADQRVPGGRAVGRRLGAAEPLRHRGELRGADERAGLEHARPARPDRSERSLLRCRPADAGAAERAGPRGVAPRLLRRGVGGPPDRPAAAQFAGLPNGHEGSHQFLVDDFVTACVRGTLPPNHVWAAARYCAPGIVAHQSAQRGGERLPIPDGGAPPGPVA